MKIDITYMGSRESTHQRYSHSFERLIGTAHVLARPATWILIFPQQLISSNVVKKTNKKTPFKHQTQTTLETRKIKKYKNYIRNRGVERGIW